MNCPSAWIRGPVGIDAGLRITRRDCRNVLVMMPSMAAGTRLLDLLPLVETDHRVQVVFTTPAEHEHWYGVEEFTRRCGGIVLPWSQAVRERWDLVLSASHRHLERVHGPILVLPHGAGSLKSLRRSRKAGRATRDTTGLDRDLLTYRGRLLPAALALAHDLELVALRDTCPEAEAVAVVAGDLCLDRMVVSTAFRERYREMLGVTGDQELVVVSSTWTANSTFGSHLELFERLVVEADERTKVAAVLHPLIQTTHGARQVRSWLAPALSSGLVLIPPEEGWRAAMIAADHVIGDFGSTTSYAAAIGRPVRLAAFPDQAVRAGSIAAAVTEIAPRLDHERPVFRQLRDGHPTGDHRRLAKLVSSRPGASARIYRSTMYRLLELDEPSWPARTAALPGPLAAQGCGHVG
jgi:hypothetical protein